jgi:cell fate regulator YaaT (PSP1 superfamily)
MKIKVTREYTLDEKKVKEYMRENQIFSTEEKNNFYLSLINAENWLLEKLSVYKANISTTVERK